MNTDTEYLHQMLDRACNLIDSLEDLHRLINERDYRDSELGKSVDRFFNDIKELNKNN